MTAPQVVVRSRDNTQLKWLRRLAQESSFYRREGRFWVEGDHLCRAARLRGLQPELVVCAESAWVAGGAGVLVDGAKTLVLADALFAEVSALESSVGVGWVLALPSEATLRPGVATVVLDRLQDAGNVGAVLRCAAAFGFAQVLAIKGTAALWSAKVLRAGMGAHFGLHLVEGASVADVAALNLPALATSSHEGGFIHELALPWPCAWLMGHEGQGVSDALMALAQTRVRIAQPGGEESLNVATAAAICLHASASQALVAGTLRAGG